MAASVGLAALKAAAWLVTGSVALLASAVDSAVDALASFANFMVVREAARPADAGHPFGHGKLEHLGSLFQSLLIAAAGLGVLFEGIERIGSTHAVRHFEVGIAAAVASIGAAWLIASRLRRAARRLDSPALAGDADHYTSDLLSNLGVIAALVAAHLGYPQADAVVCLVIAALICVMAWKLFRSSADALMDSALDDDEMARIRDVLVSFEPRIHGWHELRARRAGPDRFVQVHIEIDGQVSLRVAHDLVEDVTDAISEALGGAVVTIHADPWPNPERR